jgi:hypothetical protein
MNYTSSPLITHLLAAELYEKSKIPKPTALGTPLRYSSSFGCARQQAYAACNAIPTEPMDESGAWVTGLGTIIHEALQEAISRVYPNAEFEVASGDNYLSGSCDALLQIDGEWVLFELKTMGTYSFDSQVGWNRMRGTFKDNAEGPALKAIAQAGMNALGIEKSRGIRINRIIMGSITFEALSKNKAASMDVSGYNRFLAEFHVGREEWLELATSEHNRMTAIADLVENGFLPEREARTDDGSIVYLTPGGRNWQCDYCAYYTTCSQDGANVLRVTDSKMMIGEQQ